MYSKDKHMMLQALMKINVFKLRMGNEPERRTQASLKYWAGHNRRVG